LSLKKYKNIVFESLSTMRGNVLFCVPFYGDADDGYGIGDLLSARFLGTQTITAEGTQDQLAGFLCFLGAQFEGGMGEPGMQALSNIWEPHYHFDTSKEEMARLHFSYAISVAPPICEYGVTFLTNNLEQFVSGMMSVPMTIIGHCEEDDEDVEMSVRDPDWLQHARYLDISTDDRRDAFAENDIDFEQHGIPLANVATGRVPPMIINISL